MLLRSKGFNRQEIDGILQTVKRKNLGPAIMARLSRNLQVEDSSEDDVSEGEGSKEDMDEVELESPQPSVSSK